MAHLAILVALILQACVKVQSSTPSTYYFKFPKHLQYFHCAPQYTLCVRPFGAAAAPSIPTERGCTKDTCSRGRYVFRSTAQRPPMCLQVSGQLAGLSELFGDWPRAKRWRRIVMLMYLPPAPLRGSSSYVLIDWAPASIALFNPVGLARGLLTHSMKRPRRWQEDLPLILADIGQPGRQGCNREHVKPQFPEENFDAPEHDCSVH